MKNAKKHLSILSLIFLFLFTTPIFSVEIRPVPWLTQDAIVFLEDFFQRNPHAKILEFGSGASTVWFAKRTPHLISVEGNGKWYKAVSIALKKDKNCYPVDYRLVPKLCYTVCENLPKNSFDLILVDGVLRNECIEFSIPLLKNGGILMVDNAERPEYQTGLSLLSSWTKTTTEQKSKDSCGFFYEGWQTCWWVKQ